jgi:hypothetical protein
MNLVTAAALDADSAGVDLRWNCISTGINCPGFSVEFYQEARLPDNLTESGQWRDNTCLSCPSFCLAPRSGDFPSHAEDI